MNFILYPFISLWSKRKSQLQKQEKIDNKLKKLLNECPKKISLYLLYQRELNRKMTEEYEKVGFSDYIGLMKRQIETIDENLEKFDKVRNCRDLIGLF